MRRSRSELRLAPLILLCTPACDQLAPATDVPSIVRRPLDDRTEPEPPREEPDDPGAPGFEGATWDLFDDPFPFHPEVLDLCEPDVLRELTSFTDGVRMAYQGLATTGWSVTAVRTQADGSRCIVSDADGVARSLADGDLPYTTATRQNIASVSKSFAAIALIDAMRNHEPPIMPFERVSTYLPADWSYGPGTWTITFEELLTHTSGMGKIGDGLDSIKAWFEDADCAGLLSLSCWTRGMRNYSNAGFVLIQYLFGRLAYPEAFSDDITLLGPYGDQFLSGLLLETHVQSRYLAPHGLSASCMFDGDDAYAYLAGSQNNPIALGKHPLSAAASRRRCGAGGMSATSRDVALGLSFFHDGELDLGDASDWVDDIEDNAFGFDGWMKTPGGERYLSKGGLLPMQKEPPIQYKTLAIILPDSDTTVMMQVNDASPLGSTFGIAWDFRAK